MCSVLPLCLTYIPQFVINASQPASDKIFDVSAFEKFLHDKIKARTLFATHYHELTKLAEERKGVANFNVAVREWNEQIIFLRKIIPGGADKSYGIHVARLAGVPKEILDRAKDILSHLEKPNGAVEVQKPVKGRRSRKPAPAPEKPQLDLF